MIPTKYKTLFIGIRLTPYSCTYYTYRNIVGTFKREGEISEEKAESLMLDTLDNSLKEYYPEVLI